MGRGAQRKRRAKDGEIVNDEANEVLVVPGQCVTWNCYNPAPDGPECPVHAAELLPVLVRKSRAGEYRKRALEDPEWAERRRESKRGVKQDRSKYNELRRKRRVEARIAEGLDAGTPLQTARRERRHDTILARLREHGSVAVGELAKEFGVNPGCITEDIRHLVDQGLAERVYGGARLPLESTSNHEVGSIA